MSLSENKVDIIIPIYNAFEELVRCVDSIINWTDLKKNRLILINDKSTDDRIYTYLEKIKRESIIVIHNNMNQGFSANINIGMAQSAERDVILLNSDTVVTKGWVEKLEACAYSDRAIATATPLSNNATLCSVPDFCEENKLPDGYTVDEYADLIERISLNRYPRIPVAHGFCMYVKREIIEKIGNFDAKTFERGYGEENDFCFRAIEAGYYHVMCDNTFILHTGTSSFVSEEKKRYIAEHEKIIEERYPELNQDIRIHCRDNPNAMVSENVRFWTDFSRRDKRKTIMFLVQSDFRTGAENNVGGTQLHVKDLTIGLRDKFDILVAARNKCYLNVTLYTNNREYFFKYFIGEAERYSQFRSEKFAQLYGNILQNFQVDCVHIHHTLGLTLELFYEADRRNIPVFATIHDYYYICPTVNLISYRTELCIGKENEELCGQCLKAKMGIADTVPYLHIWRSENLKALKLAKLIFTPSKSAKEIFSVYFKELEDKIRVVEHGSESMQVSDDTAVSSKCNSFHVAFIGGINVIKGYQCVTELIKKGNRDIRWHLFGSFEREDASLGKKGNFINAGAYEREDLPDLMKKYAIDLVCILPIWPETFCYTLSEAVLCGVPVLATDIGALGERVSDLDCGWVVPGNSSSKEILELIDYIRDNPGEYEQKAVNIKKIKLRTMGEMCTAYQEIYDSVQEKFTDAESNSDLQWLLEGVMCGKGKSVMSGRYGENMAEQLEAVQNELFGVYNSFTYRVMQRIAKLKIPFRKQIKAIVFKIYRAVGKKV